MHREDSFELGLHESEGLYHGLEDRAATVITRIREEVAAISPLRVQTSIYDCKACQDISH